MMKQLFLLAFICGIGLLSCDKTEDSTYSEDEIVESYIYRERDPNYPLILSRPRERVATRATELKFDDILGRSFKLEYFPFENMLNIGEPVISMTKLEADKPEWMTKIPLRQSTSNAFSYSTFDRYEENSTITEKVTSGFEINLGLFKIGNKKTYYEHFTTTLIENSNSVFGQLDIEIKDAAYNLAVNSNRLNEIRKDYIEKDFVDDLYNLPSQELFSFYGPFVMTNFITGGRATALFAGITKTSAIGKAREESMNSEMSASFSLRKDSLSSISLGFGKGFTNGSSSTETFTQLHTTLVTSGGSYGFGAFTIPKSIDNMNIDLTAWASSLNDKDKQTLINIGDKGLIPLSEFFIEANLKAQYKNYLEGKDLPSKKFVEPKLIQCRIKGITDKRILSISQIIFLITRFNDAIEIRRDVISFDGLSAIKNLDVVFDELCDRYKIRAEINGSTLNERLFNSCQNIAEKITFNGTFEEGISIESKMKKYYNAGSDVLYLLYNENGKKAGYAIYLGKGDYLLDTYGIRSWVDAMPSTAIYGSELLDYTLIAL